MIEHNGSWLPSVSIGLPALGLGVLICLALIAVVAWFSDGPGDFWALAIMPILGVLALLIAPAFGYWPYEGDYHRLQPASGVVKTVDTRFMAASQYVVVTYEGGLTVRCDDSRCATVRPGDSLRLLCTKEHQFGSPLSADGWGCRWGQAA